MLYPTCEQVQAIFSLPAVNGSKRFLVVFTLERSVLGIPMYFKVHDHDHGTLKFRNVLAMWSVLMCEFLTVPRNVELVRTVYIYSHYANDQVKHVDRVDRVECMDI